MFERLAGGKPETRLFTAGPGRAIRRSTVHHRRGDRRRRWRELGRTVTDDLWLQTEYVLISTTILSRCLASLTGGGLTLPRRFFRSHSGLMCSWTGRKRRSRW